MEKEEKKPQVETTTKKVVAKKDESKRQVKENPILSKEMTASQLADMIGLNSGAKLWVSKTFKANEIKTAKYWVNEFIKSGAIHEIPTILK